LGDRRAALAIRERALPCAEITDIVARMAMSIASSTLLREAAGRHALELLRHARS